MRQRSATLIPVIALGLGLGVAACRETQPTASSPSNPLTLTSSLSRAQRLGPAASDPGGWAVQRSVTTEPGENGSSNSSFDAEEAPDWGVVGDLYAAEYGIHFENAMGISLPPWSYYPPRSGGRVMTAIIPPSHTGGDGHVTVTFSPSVTVFGAYATSAMPLTLACFDSAGTTVGTEELPTPNLNNGDSPFSPNQQIEVRGDGIARCVFDGSNNLYGFDDFYISRVAEPKLTVKCDPDSPMPRGEWVRCTATLEPKKTAFTIIEQRAEAEGHVYVDSTPKPVIERGDFEYDWGGHAIVDTRVTMKARVVLHGDTITVTSDPVEFGVKSRMKIGNESWPRLTLPDTAPTPHVDTTQSLTDPPFELDTIKVKASTYVHWYTAAKGGLGVTKLDLNYQYEHETKGPNTNWLYVTDSATITRNAIFYSKHLDSTDTFYKQQNGGKVLIEGGRYTGCNSADMKSLRGQTFAHEGGHYAVNKTFFAEHDVQAAYEGIHVYLDPTSPGAVTPNVAIHAAVDSAYGAALHSLQKPIDGKNTPYPLKLSCFFHGPFPGIK